MRRMPCIAELVLVKEPELKAGAIKAEFDDVAKPFAREAVSASLWTFLELEEDHTVIVAESSCDACEFVLATFRT